MLHASFLLQLETESSNFWSSLESKSIRTIRLSRSSLAVYDSIVILSSISPNGRIAGQDNGSGLNKGSVGITRFNSNGISGILNELVLGASKIVPPFMQ